MVQKIEGTKKKNDGTKKSMVESLGAFNSTKNSGSSRRGSEWNRHFPEFHSEILSEPREVGLKFRKIGITGKFRSFDHSCPGLVSPSQEIELNMADPQASKYNINALSDKRLKNVTSTFFRCIGLNRLYCVLHKIHELREMWV